MATSTLLTTLIEGALTSVSASRAASSSAAGRISAQCEGTLTGSGRARFAPFCLQISMARSMAARLPAITTWPGELKFTALATSPCAACSQAARTCSSSRPRMAALALAHRPLRRPPAERDQLHRVAEAKRAGADQVGRLAEAVPGHGLGTIRGMRREGAPHGDARGQQRRLGAPRGVELAFRAFLHE